MVQSIVRPPTVTTRLVKAYRFASVPPESQIVAVVVVFDWLRLVIPEGTTQLLD
jgi:hypothetical protein